MSPLTPTISRHSPHRGTHPLPLSVRGVGQQRVVHNVDFQLTRRNALALSPNGVRLLGCLQPATATDVAINHVAAQTAHAHIHTTGLSHCGCRKYIAGSHVPQNIRDIGFEALILPHGEAGKLEPALEQRPARCTLSRTRGKPQVSYRKRPRNSAHTLLAEPRLASPRTHGRTRTRVRNESP
jgi:hypothetical protein